MSKYDTLTQALGRPSALDKTSDAERTGIYCSLSPSGNLLERGRDPLAQITQKHGVSIQTEGALRLHADLVSHAKDFVSLCVKSAQRIGAASPAAQMLRLAVGLLGVEVHERPKTLAEMWLNYEDRLLSERLIEAGQTGEFKERPSLPGDRRGGGAGQEHKEEIAEWQYRVLDKLRVHIEAADRGSPKASSEGKQMSIATLESLEDGHDWGPDFIEHLDLASFIMDKISTAVGVLQDPEQVDRPMILSNFTESMASQVCGDLRQWLEQLSTLFSLYHVHLLDMANECKAMKAHIGKVEAQNAELDRLQKEAVMRHDRLQEQFRQSKLKGNAELKLGITIAEEDLAIYSQKDMDDEKVRWETEELEPIMNDLKELRNAHHDLLRKRRQDAERERIGAPSPKGDKISQDTQFALASALGALSERIQGKQVSELCSRLVKALSGHSEDVKDLAAELTGMLSNPATPVMPLPTPVALSREASKTQRLSTSSYEGAEPTPQGRLSMTQLAAGRSPGEAETRSTLEIPGTPSRALSTPKSQAHAPADGHRGSTSSLSPNDKEAGKSAAGEKKNSLTPATGGQKAAPGGTRPKPRQTLLAPSDVKHADSNAAADPSARGSSKEPWKVPHGTAMTGKPLGYLGSDGDEGSMKSSFSPSSTGESWLRASSSKEPPQPWKSGGKAGIPSVPDNAADETGSSSEADDGGEYQHAKSLPARRFSATKRGSLNTEADGGSSPSSRSRRQTQADVPARRTSFVDRSSKEPPPMRFGMAGSNPNDFITNTMRGGRSRKSSVSGMVSAASLAEDASPRDTSRGRAFKGVTGDVDPNEQPPALCLEAARNELLYLEAVLKNASGAASLQDAVEVLAWAADTIFQGKSAWCLTASGKRSISDPVRWLPAPDRNANLAAKLVAGVSDKGSPCSTGVAAVRRASATGANAALAAAAKAAAGARGSMVLVGAQNKMVGTGGINLAGTLQGARTTAQSTAVPPTSMQATALSGFDDLASMSASAMGITGMSNGRGASRGDMRSSGSSRGSMRVQPSPTSWPVARPHDLDDSVLVGSGVRIGTKTSEGSDRQGSKAVTPASVPGVALGPFDVMALQGFASGVEGEGGRATRSPDPRMRALWKELEKRMGEIRALSKDQSSTQLQEMEQLSMHGAKAEESMRELKMRLEHMEKLLGSHGVDAKMFEAAMAKSGVAEFLQKGAGDVFERLYQDALNRMHAFADMQTQQLELATEVYFNTLAQVVSSASATNGTPLPSSRGGQRFVTESDESPGPGSRRRASSWPSATPPSRHAHIPTRVAVGPLAPEVIPLMPLHMRQGARINDLMRAFPGSGMVPFRRRVDHRTYESADFRGLLPPLPGMGPIPDGVDGRCHNTFQWHSTPQQRLLTPTEAIALRGRQYLKFDGNAWPGLSKSHLQAQQQAQSSKERLHAEHEAAARHGATGQGSHGFAHAGIAAHAAATASVHSMPSRPHVPANAGARKPPEVLPDLTVQRLGKSGGDDPPAAKEKAASPVAHSHSKVTSKGKGNTERMPPLTKTGGAASMPQLGKGKKDLAKAY
mmetsp:Transcript_59800/g.142370  ORF Transcript_59800/g.142370 Transcript_59800/m.142370 type:complete len:1552 (+) Transcript_59800:167-4822(+)|eukprot:CAMPEP_0178374620 /NCGR_PEP_ID=MMETSP0689_2-20121128/2470_1 /TAXON_ID=160604 /ORGANISM="Amphidinium massartii, Strain CS-259" /LENGTH=1551 /DNA_ID=CAMNT_0019994595 /DNA_START=75 /DNA_END=4730 /DNA_ORIENTATION=+